MEILGGAEVDLFVPSFPDLQATFNLSPFMVELMLGVNLTAHCVTSLMVGNLGDKYGRKPIILIGLIIFIAGSLFCVFASSYLQLLFGRFLQGIGISGPVVLSYLIIADIYSVEKQQQMMGIINGTISLAMAMAPVIGSYVNLFFNWRGNFVILLALGVLSFVMTLLFIPKSVSNPKISISLKEYLIVIKSPKALYYIITICFLIQAYWIFIGMSPILYMQDLHVPLKEFGFYQGAMALLFSFISFYSSYFITKFSQKICFIFGIACLVVFVFANGLIIIFNISSPLIITMVMQLLAIGSIFPCNILWPLTLEAVPEARGRIAALVVSSRLIVTAISLQLASYFYRGTITSISIVMCITIFISFWACFKLSKKDKIFL